MMSESTRRGGSNLLLAHSLIVLAALTAAAQQPAAEPSPAKTAESNVISGRVVNESGQPIPGVNIFIGDFGGPNSHRTATDSEGNFTAQGLDPGFYRVFANSAGYVSPAPPAGLNNPPPFYRPGDSVSFTLTKGAVIAGTITNTAGEPVVNVSVRAHRVRDAEGKVLPIATPSQQRMTDDRGYYRIYGLQPGSYVISAGGQGQYFGGANPYANDAPTYAPASTRDTAVEVAVRAGEETAVDIRYRGEPGHSISGKLSGVQTTLPYVPSVRLSDSESHFLISGASVAGEARTFQLNGVSDGEYEISALGGAGPNTEMVASAARRVSVKGSDVTGIELVLAPLASISGRVNVEPDDKLNCGRRRDNALREILISVRRDRVDAKPATPKDKSAQMIEPTAILPISADVVPNQKGEVVFRNLASGTYRLDARLPGAGWYLKTIVLGSADQKTTAGRTVDANIARDGIPLKSGDKVTGVTVNIAEGGAGLRGRISFAETQRVPNNLRVNLVPAEREATENVLRFFEARVENDGSFAIGNIAPGRYFVIQRIVDETDATKLRSIREDSALRARILREAGVLKKEISFKPCERTLDFDLPYSSGDPKP